MAYVILSRCVGQERIEPDGRVQVDRGTDPQRVFTKGRIVATGDVC